MSGSDYDALLRRRRIWGVPPDVVAHLVAECERTQTESRARIAEMETRLTHALAERDEANRMIADLQEQLARLAQEKEEIANRPETVREEAVRFVVDAWAEAQALRAQTRQAIEEGETTARAEVAAIHQALIGERVQHEMEMREERQRHEAEIALLRERRQKAIADLESLAESLLTQASRGASTQSASTAPASLSVPTAARPVTTVAAASAPAPEAGQSQPATPQAVAPASESKLTPAEDKLLTKALDDLEAILGARKSNGMG